MHPIFVVQAHQNKAKAFIDALERRGWRQGTYDQAEFFLTDSDVNGREDKIKALAERGVKTFIYPHAARPDLINDFDGCDPCQYVSSHFIVAEGHRDVMKAFGYPTRTEVVGWSYCQIKPFRPRGRIRTVVFAPIHPSPNGVLNEIDRSINYTVFKKLTALADDGKIFLVVRYLYNLERSGLWPDPCAQYIQGKPDLSHALIDSADVVVAHQTYAHLAIARGVPTVMMGEWERPRYTLAGGQTKFARSWDKYRDLLMYPIDILDGEEDDPMNVLRRAARSDEEIADWRRRMIGEQFCPDKFVDLIETLVKARE